MQFEFVLTSGWASDTFYDSLTLTDAISRSLDFQLNGVHSASITLPLTSPVASFVEPGVTSLEVWRTRDTSEGTSTRQLVFRGEVPASCVKMNAATDTMELVFKDPRWRWEYMYPPTNMLSFTSTDVGEIIWSVLEEWSVTWYWGGWPCGQGSTSTGLLKSVQFDPANKLADEFGALTKLVDGPDIDVSFSTGAALLDVFARMGIDRPSVSLRYGYDQGSGASLDSNVRDVTQTFTDPFNMFQVKWTSSESGQGSDTGWDWDTDSGTTYRVLQKIAQLSDAIPNSYAQFVLDGMKGALLAPRSILEVKGLTYEAPQPFVHFYLGDTVYVTAKKGALQVDSQGLRVHGIHIDVDQEGNPQTDITTAEI